MRAYRLLVEVMASTDCVAVGRFVMHTTEYLAAVRVREGVLPLTTMRFDDDVRDTVGRQRHRQAFEEEARGGSR